MKKITISILPFLQSSSIINLEQKDLAFSAGLSRYPLQSYVPNTGTQGFSLLSGLKEDILLFYHHSKKEKN